MAREVEMDEVSQRCVGCIIFRYFHWDLYCSQWFGLNKMGPYGDQGESSSFSRELCSVGTHCL